MNKKIIKKINKKIFINTIKKIQEDFVQLCNDLAYEKVDYAKTLNSVCRSSRTGDCDGCPYEEVCIYLILSKLDNRLEYMYGDKK